ncbi:hypothetical protein BD560DRAFT_54969 [Blakeslea trispora]|nr:hypothetical protein BD560DRAFT_54969 [Blakeslea trispora]
MTAVLDHITNSIKRKKVTRACLHCQKAHLTCDDARPCDRCVRRDLASTCTDATRKKAKYLQEIDHTFKKEMEDTPISLDTFSLFDMTNTDQLFNFSLVDLGFGSATAGLEYGMLGNMLQDPLLDLALTETTASPHQLPSYTSQMSPLQHISPLPSSSSPTKKSKQRIRIETYPDVKKPYNYAEGFHYLIQYVKERMSRNDLMRISKALALFRPSFLTLIMNLTEEDLIFMEKCLQRTLLEYEKLISFSGTPTVVWRRTGEICLVGKEFLLLTQWKREAILNKKTYIYELMDGQSAVEYWEKFSLHAFDNASKSCVYSCIIKTPQEKLVPCTFCFTIKRDIFDLPSVIVGNFLPILS